MLRGLVRTARPHQWVKNLFVLAPLVFAKELFDPPQALRALAATALFCLASSAVYVLNDVLDVAADRAHPRKRSRPIASGAVPLRVAWLAMGALAAASVGAGLLVAPGFSAAVVGYLVLNAAYSTRLKHVAYIDVVCIALGFELRVLGGSFAAHVPPSAYLLVVTFLLATFLGFGKRMHELVHSEDSARQRVALEGYRERILSILLYTTAVATVVTYVVYTLDPDTRAYFGSDYLPATGLFACFGVLRFVRLVRHRGEAESPTDEMLRDRWFLVNLGAWAASVVLVVYFT